MATQTEATTHAQQAPIVHDELYIGGGWVKPSGAGTIEVRNSTTEEVMGSIPEGTPEDVDRAAAAAFEAFQTWGQTSPDERAPLLEAIAMGLEARAEEIAALVARELGMPVTQALFIQAGLPRMSFASMVEILGQTPFEEM